MNIQELATAVLEDLPVIPFVSLIMSTFGMVTSSGSKLFYGKTVIVYNDPNPACRSLFPRRTERPWNTSTVYARISSSLQKVYRAKGIPCYYRKDEKCSRF